MKKLTNSEIRERILKSNEWLSGRVAYRDGDVMAIANAEDDFGKIITIKTVKEATRMLRKWDSVRIRLKNLVFIKHWSYGCFVYRLPNLNSYFEHLTIGAYKSDKELERDIRLMLRGKM